MWQDYFTLVKLVPGKVSVYKHGVIDFRNTKIPVPLCKKLFDEGFPYLELTKKGKQKFFPEPRKKKNEIEEISDTDPEI